MSKLQELKKASLMALSAMAIMMSTACGPKGLPPTYREIDPILEEIVLAFEEEYDVYVNYPVKVKTIKDSGVVGKCFYYVDSGVPIAIEIDPKATSTPDKLWATVTHELMHCSLGLKHYNEEVDLMNSNVDRMIDDLRWGTQSRAGLIKRVNARTGLGKSFYEE